MGQDAPGAVSALGGNKSGFSTAEMTKNRQASAALGGNGAKSGEHSGGAGGGASGPFYFYNDANVSSGKATFVAKWGKRPLADNWRVLSEMKSGGAGSDLTAIQTAKTQTITA
jgi:hypothetical protein